MTLAVSKGVLRKTGIGRNDTKKSEPQARNSSLQHINVIRYFRNDRVEPRKLAQVITSSPCIQYVYVSNFGWDTGQSG
jgi:hypothetical protein